MLYTKIHIIFATMTKTNRRKYIYKLTIMIYIYTISLYFAIVFII